MNKTNETISLKGHYKFTIRDAATGAIKRVIEVDNLIPTVGRTMIANNLASLTPDNVMAITHALLGSNTTPPANSDTQLGTEVYRNAIASLLNSNNVVTMTAFFNATEVTGTFKEAGIVCNGTGTANTGILLSHVAVNITKSNTETLTIDFTLTIN